MSQSQTGPMLINIPPPGSNPDTPSDMPGTPTSTTTSLSAISTTAIKDGHRGHAHPLQHFGGRGHQHNPSTNSLEAERADRISRLAGLERVSTLRPGGHHAAGGNQQTTPTSTGFPAYPGGAPAYFDSNGQPTAANKMSTVGSASATGSVGGRTTTEGGDNHSEMGGTNTEVDDDFMSNPSNYRGNMDIDSVAGAIDQDEDMTNHSVGGFEDHDHMSDDGTASLVGFGEGANSTVSGPIYQRRPLPGGLQQQQQSSASATAWGLERSSSGLSDAAVLRNSRASDFRDSHPHSSATNDDATSQNQIPVLPGQPQTSALREGVGGPASRESAAERLIRERLDNGESEVGAHALGNPPRGAEDKLGQFYFEK
ncbi:uncharacterized protein B0I36DRAFT_253838 [Microdochium trichocladiopsis]|uniref:Uncharacterized protein n=1 Tax=Microdochium trichocladiopsis TaxID=1682393 RepID=A0A9P8XW99_9PEZI|nr:uncharacterized protein B0I36DRAFT_253838 [Microdochium trichocladiopsis]KAH7018169.1 hypothetical protein B0I36DRAFT_253838 [Microdochium trichocladiopsis]